MVDGVLDAFFVATDDKYIFIGIVIAFVACMGPAITQHMFRFLQVPFNIYYFLF